MRLELFKSKSRSNRQSRKIGPTVSHLLTVRAEGADPPPLTVSLTVKRPGFFDDRPKEILENINIDKKILEIIESVRIWHMEQG